MAGSALPSFSHATAAPRADVRVRGYATAYAYAFRTPVAPRHPIPLRRARGFAGRAAVARRGQREARVRTAVDDQIEGRHAVTKHRVRLVA